MKPSTVLTWMLMLSLIGCQKLSLRSQTPDEDDDGDGTAKKTVLIGEQVTIAGLHPIQIEGVALVTHLDNTGGDPPPSLYRTLLLEYMKKRQVPNPNQLLQSPTTALVLVRAALPPSIQYGDKFDVEVVLPDNTDATSLSGGWLMECDLAEQAIVPGRGAVPGFVLGRATGPIMLSTGEGDEASQASGLKRGRVLGGGAYVGGINHKDRKLGLYLRNEFRNTRQSQRIADRISRRFHYYDRGIKRGLAKATTDQHIELTVHPLYKQNYVRFVQVIRALALSETAVEEHDRLQRLKKSLLVPQTAARSAQSLEAIGNESIPVLKEGLQSPVAEVRFYSADALAYLGDSSGARELAAAAKNEDAFRVFALAALSIIDDGSTHELLRGLMDQQSAETRYGAFRSLWTIDKHDPFIRGERINDEFNLHVLRTGGEPMLHLTRYRVPEVVVFGGEQELRPPIALSAGRHIIINAPVGSSTVTVSRFAPNQPDAQRVVSLRVADVIRAVGELKGSYPDVAQMLFQAERQSNLSGRLALDALPQAGRIYYRPSAGTEAAEKETRIGKPSLSPNLFPSVKEPEGTEPGIKGGDNLLKPEVVPEMTDADEAGPDAEDDAETETVKPRSKPGRLTGLFKNPFKRQPVESEE